VLRPHTWLTGRGGRKKRWIGMMRYGDYDDNKDNDDDDDDDDDGFKMSKLGVDLYVLQES